ncbi:Lsr2 family protein [Glutamicibacter sp. PS]|uniref:histone-like nucleoid-structuring protein Lsr2 n=1 Tax=Glutamicibacter TaxID=1742989 RepID=UPI0028457A46|nr:Lsr2 family protein [Glutamicibacter sp. PS]MDR4534812.1 Lsr2 family protein [Glutamicibacter sp. PS]
MARQVQIALIDDIDGSEASESIAFSVGGQHFEIDLNTEHAEEFRAAIEPYIEAARSSKSSTAEAPAIRAWAKENNIQVNARGRLNSEVIDAYHAAMRKGRGRSKS